MPAQGPDSRAACVGLGVTGREQSLAGWLPHSQVRFQGVGEPILTWELEPLTALWIELMNRFCSLTELKEIRVKSRISALLILMKKKKNPSVSSN